MAVAKKSTIEQCNAAEFHGNTSDTTQLAQPQGNNEKELLAAFSELNDTSRLREQFLDCIKNLLKRQRGNNPYPGHDSILTTLGMMQNNIELLHADEESGRRANRNNLTQSIDDFFNVLVSVSVGSIKPAHHDIVDNVKRTFERLFQDDRLSPVFKALITQLQIPYLKLAFMDKSFLENEEHPATQVLKKLIFAGARWGHNKQYYTDPLYKESLRLVNSIVDEFDDKVEFFHKIVSASVLFKSKTHASPQNKTGGGNMNNKQSQIQSQVQVKPSPSPQVAQADIKSWIEGKTNGKDLGQGVLSFLTGPWAMVMNRVYHQHGKKHQLWDKVSGVVDRVIWCTESKPGKQQKQDLETRFPGLLIDIEEGLQLISVSRTSRESMIAVLLKTYTAHLTEVFRYK